MPQALLSSRPELVALVCLVYLVYLVEPDQQEKPSEPDKPGSSRLFRAVTLLSPYLGAGKN